MNTKYDEILNLFKKYKVDGFVNISQSSSKSLEYSPLHNEISLDSSDNTSTNLTIIKEHKKWVFKIDWFDLEKIENAFIDLLKIIDFAEYDEDIILPNITDTLSKDFSSKELFDIDFDYLEKQAKKFINFPFEKNIKIEGFSIWVSNWAYTYINSNWSIKTQSDNWSFYYMDIYWENWEVVDNNYISKSLKQKPVITDEEIIKLQKELLFKIWETKTSFTPWDYDITLDRDVVIDFLDIVLGNMSAEGIRLWISLFAKNNIWDKIFWNNFTLKNNPTLENYTWDVLFDKEWVTQKETILFESWILKAKFYDYKNALKDWLENLWNSWVSNIEMIWETSKNYLVWSKILFTNLMAFHTVDEMTWKFSLNWEWYLLDENGEKNDYIKNISLSGDIISLFSSIKSIWDDYKDDWNFKVPSVSFYNQKVV